MYRIHGKHRNLRASLLKLGRAREERARAGQWIRGWRAGTAVDIRCAGRAANRWSPR